MAHDVLATDILILGGGGAALTAALHARERAPALDITVVVKGLLGKSGCTRMVQGGYNAVLREGDSFERHFEDTISGGARLNDQDLVWILITRAPQMLLELENRYGCFFDRTPTGTIHQKAFGGQSFDRTVHRGDLTGIEIMERLRDAVLGRQIRVLEDARAIGLIKDRDSRRVCGSVLLDIRRGSFVVARAGAVLLATGGGPTMYAVSTPSREKTTDGIAMAYEAGAELMDMEMVQFHPTGIVVEGSELHGAPLEEGLRGAGARLFNAQGERFMDRYDPQRLERSTRDIVSRACYQEVTDGRGTPGGGVWLDMSHLGAAFVEREFPGMVERTRAAGSDLASGPVEVSPTAHFLMSGVRIDERCRTTLDGLYAAGEDAAGVQGANRLGGNGVAESIVFGALAGDVMAEEVIGRPRPVPDEREVDRVIADATAPLDRAEGVDAFALLDRMRTLMWQKVGIIRDGPGLQEAVGELVELAGFARKLSARGAPRANPEWQIALNARSLVVTSELIARAALARQESRGAHFRRDFPAENDAAWLKHLVVKKGADGPEIATRPIRVRRREALTGAQR